ncbi:MAG: hypothetical protein R3302_08010, partial [Sulfurimonadaceae bacterium]|nr:hypothetical protein [Sulfurimonadaceae bacterium]
DNSGKEHALGGQNGKTQLIITTPFIDDAFVEELKAIEKELPKGGEYEVTASLVVANDSHDDPNLDEFDFYMDLGEEFGDWYSVRLVGEPCGGEFAKALFVISKDGALFYDEFAGNVHDKFNADTLLRKIAAAQTCYTGKGCH